MIKNDNKATSTSYKVCSDCGITHTPLWRGGPNGPKTMCNACGIRWKRAHQNGHKPNKAYNDQKTSKLDYLSEDDERDEYDSAEELLMLSDPENSAPKSSPLRETVDSNDTAPRKKKSLKKKSLQSGRSKPYSRRSSTERDLEHEAEDSILLLQQAAEEFGRLDYTPADLEAVSSPIATSFHGSANASPTPVNMSATSTTDRSKDDLLMSEMNALREEIQKRDAIINMYKAKVTEFPHSGLTERTAHVMPPTLTAM